MSYKLSYWTFGAVENSSRKMTNAKDGGSWIAWRNKQFWSLVVSVEFL